MPAAMRARPGARGPALRRDRTRTRPEAARQQVEERQPAVAQLDQVAISPRSGVRTCVDSAQAREHAGEPSALTDAAPPVFVPSVPQRLLATLDLRC